jgi:phosphohistidine phosphatase
MKRVMLLRHAKAGFAGGTGDDHARPLIQRGHEDSGRMGAFIQKAGYTPDIVLCSPALRTAQTWAAVQAELGSKVPALFVDALYLAPASRIFSTIRTIAPQDARAVLVIGHNPGLGDSARDLAGTPQDAAARERAAYLAEKFPTCALAVFDCAIANWKDLTPKTGILLQVIRAKDLRNP